jgi:hypothetical protein
MDVVSYFTMYTSLQRKENYGREYWYFTSMVGLVSRTVFVYHFAQSVTLFFISGTSIQYFYLLLENQSGRRGRLRINTTHQRVCHR